MPLYDIQCQKTGVKFERFIKLEFFSEPINCACGSPAKRLISRPLISVDTTGYHCPVTGQWIGSKREHRENLQRQGCRVLEGGEKELNDKIRRDEEAVFDQKIEETVEREIETLSSAKKEELHNELVNTKLDVVVERK